MRNAVAGSLGGIAILALALRAVFPGGTPIPVTGNAAPTPGDTTQDTSQSSSDEGSGKFLLEGPWIATRAYFHVPPAPFNPKAGVTARELAEAGSYPDRAALCELLGAGAACGPGPEIRSIVATFPDPLHTRLSLALDGQMEAILRSLAEVGWSFAGQWLPWTDHPDVDTSDLAGIHSQNALKRRQEAMPGVLIFRSGAPFEPPRTLLVWVVGETPAGGVRAAPFFASLHMAEALGDGHEIGLLAPCFSGSFPSIAQLVRQWSRDAGRAHRLHHTVFSGHVSDQDSAREFACETGLEMRGGTFNARAFNCAIARTLGRFGIAAQEAALLKEDNSGYSQAVSRPAAAARKEGALAPRKMKAVPAEGPAGGGSGCPLPAGEEPEPGCPNQLPTYVFPREISHLRNAYPDTASAASRNPYLAQAPRVGLTLKDPGIGEDSVPGFSGVQEVLAQQALLDAIAGDFRRRHTRLAVIVATNSLDSLFLARVLHRDAPDTRVLVDRPHVLFAPAAADSGLSGTLFFSAYPMFLEGERWLATGSNLLFPDPDTQGVFNATQLLIGDMGAWPGGARPLSLQGYRGFRQEAPRPEMWLLALTRAGFQPLDTMDLADSRQEWFRPHPTPAPAHRYPPAFPLPTSWAITAAALSLAVLAACLVFFLAGMDARGRYPLWLFMGEASAARTEALLGMALAMSALEWLIALPVWLSAPEWLDWGSLSGWLGFGASVLAAAGVLAPPMCFAASGAARAWMARPRGLARVYAPPLALYLAVVAGWSAACAGQDPAAVLLRYRAASLFRGIPPVWPPVLLCLLLLYFSYSRFRRHTAAEIDAPRLALCRGMDFAARSARRRWDWVGLKTSYCALNAHIQARLKRGAWRRPGIASGFATVALLLLWRPAQAFEPQAAYSLVLRAGLAAVFYWLGTALYDIWLIGGRLRSFLELGELLPLGEALRHVARSWPRQTIWAFRLRQSALRLRIRRQMLAALLARKLSLAGDEAERAGEDYRRLCGLACGSGPEARGPSAGRVQGLEEFQRGAAELARKVLWHDLAPVWGQSACCGEEPERPENGRTEGPEAPQGSAEFVALQFCRFIVYAIEQLEREAKCVWMSFLILIVFFNSYNLQGPQFVARLLAVVFLLIAVDVVRVIVPVERNSMASWISRSTPGKLNSEFWMRLVFLGGLPLLGIVAHLFPQISEFLSRWIAPSFDALH